MHTTHLCRGWFPREHNVPVLFASWSPSRKPLQAGGQRSQPSGAQLRSVRWRLPTPCLLHRAINEEKVEEATQSRWQGISFPSLMLPADRRLKTLTWWREPCQEPPSGPGREQESRGARARATPQVRRKWTGREGHSHLPLVGHHLVEERAAAEGAGPPGGQARPVTVPVGRQPSRSQPRTGAAGGASVPAEPATRAQALGEREALPGWRRGRPRWRLQDEQPPARCAWKEPGPGQRGEAPCAGVSGVCFMERRRRCLCPAQHPKALEKEPGCASRDSPLALPFSPRSLRRGRHRGTSRFARWIPNRRSGSFVAPSGFPACPCGCDAACFLPAPLGLNPGLLPPGSLALAPE